MLREKYKYKCYPCLKCCVSFRTEDAISENLDYGTWFWM